MNRMIWRAGSLVALIGMCALLPSCKEDEPPAKPKLSVAEKTLTLKESDGEVEIEFALDKAASQDIEIDYSITGTAVEAANASQNLAPDYEIIGDYLKCKIKAGETKGIITLGIYSDIRFEDDETIEIQIDEVDWDGIEITREDEVNITLKQEDGLLVVLEWGVGTGEKYTDVDMDLFLWQESDLGDLTPTVYGSYIASPFSPEYFILPSKAADGTYGLSCVYYEGSVEPMNFQISYIKIVNQDDVSTVVKKGTYTKANINAWDTSGIDPKLATTFEKSGSDFTNFSEISVAASGSRTSTSLKFPKPEKKKF